VKQSMKRWLPWTLAAIVAVGVLVRVLTLQSTPSAKWYRDLRERAALSPAPPAAFPSLEARLEEDGLPPPLKGAPAGEWKDYRKALEQIRHGNDPAVSRMRLPQASQEQMQRLADRAEARRRIAAEQEQLNQEQFAAMEAELQKQQLDEAKRMAEEMRVMGETARQEYRRRMIEGGFDPDAPVTPAVTPPDFGPPTIGVPEKREEKKP